MTRVFPTEISALPSANLRGPGSIVTGRSCVERAGRRFAARYSTVTVLARFRGWSTSLPSMSAMW